MKSLEILLSNIEDVDALDSNRQDLINLLRDFLEQEGDRLTEDQKVHVSNSIGSLSLNAHAVPQPTTAWLRLCLNDFQKATGQMKYRRLRSQAGMDTVGKAELLAALDSVVRSIQSTPRS